VDKPPIYERKGVIFWLPNISAALSAIGALFIPICLFIASCNLTNQQSMLSDKAARQQQAIAQDQRYETILQSYFTDMTTLLVDDQITSTLPERTNPPLTASEETMASKIREARIVAQAKTLTTLADIDPGRRAILINFLIRAGVFQPHIFPNEKPSMQLIISFQYADLKNINLNSSRIDYINLYGADLINASLDSSSIHEANLSMAHFSHVNLNNTNLKGSYIKNASFDGAILTGADLEQTDLTNADFSGANLSEAKLNGATLNDANLTNTNITQVQLDSAASYIGAKLPPGLH